MIYKIRYLIPFLVLTVLFLVSKNPIQAQSCTPVFPATTCDVTGNVTVTAVVPDTTLTFSGYAPSGSVVYFKEGDFIVGTVVTASNGVFSKTITSTPGSHTYLIYLIDNQGRTTPEVILDPVTLITQVDIPISNIHLPPTIALSKNKVAQDQVVSIFGQAAPGSTVDLYVNGIKRYSAMVGNNNTWQFDLNAATLPDQTIFYAISTRAGLPNSQKSQTVSLEVLACNDANCNRIAQQPTDTATPSATTNSEPTRNIYNFKLEIGENLRNLLLFTSIFISFTGVLIFFLIFLFRRRKDKKKILAELEQKVEKDLQTQNPVENIRKDFDETEKKVD